MVACSADTLPATAVTATTSSRGSNRAIVRATASSMPGSQSIITFRGIFILGACGRNHSPANDSSDFEGGHKASTMGVVSLRTCWNIAVIASQLGRLAAGQDLALEEMTDVIDRVMSGAVPAGQIAVLLTALHTKGETVDEIAGAALAMRKHMKRIRTTRTGLVDTCGTGGIGSDLFNISTTAAIVAAAAGVPVAKHGNRSVTSKSGSADVLAVLGVNVDAPVETIERCLDELGICFCFAPHMHPAMKNVAPVRKQLGTPTIFILLGPLFNRARAPQ